MSLHIIVDGYNLIRQSNGLGTLEEESLEKGRDALVETLAAYKQVKGHAITVVFDGTGAAVNIQAARTRRGDIDIVFSRPGELADSVIKRIVAQEGPRAVVVSSDNEIVDYAEHRGAAAIGSAEFEAKMKNAISPPAPARALDPKGPEAWKPTTIKKGPARRRSKRERKRKVKTRKL